MKLFGFHISRLENQDETPSLVPPNYNDSAVTFDPSSGFISPFTSVMDMDSSIKEENQLIDKYRDLYKSVPEVSVTVDEICAEAIIVDDKSRPVVSINLDNVRMSDDIKEMISESFHKIMNKLNFQNSGFEIFRNWYIDGRIYFNVLIDQESPENGITELRYIDPRKIKKVREVIRDTSNEFGISTITDVKEYYIYTENPNSANNYNSNTGYTYGGYVPPNQNIPMTEDSIATSNSGIYDQSRNIILSHLYQTIRPANNLRMMEESMLIYRMTRAPERRVFYIDTGDIPRSKQEQYVQEIANKYRNKVVYDSHTGSVKNDKRYMSMTEDYFIPRPSGQSGTQIETLEGGQSVGETRDTEYFLNRLYDSMSVPKSRFSDQQSMFSSGVEITRDELRFSRFIARLRTRFSMLFEDLVGKELVLTQVMTIEEWEEIKINISFDYQEDNMFASALKTQNIATKINTVAMVDPYVGKYLSPSYVYKQVLDMTDEEIEIEQELIAQMDVQPTPPQQGVQESYSNEEILKMFDSVK